MTDDQVVFLASAFVILLGITLAARAPLTGLPPASAGRCRSRSAFQ
jgi:hypothetical protein